jgi:hypothetical protein
MYYSPRIVTSGLVLALDAAERLSYPRTGTTWRDLSGNNNTGTLTNGPTFNAGNMGNIVFDGVDDYVNCGNNSSINLTSYITLSTWTKKAYGSSASVAIDKGRDNYGAWSLLFDVVANKVEFHCRISGTNSSVVSNTSYGNNIWTNITAVFTGTNLLIYINGKLDNTTTISGTIGTNAIDFSIGKANDGFNWSGQVANVLMYNTALSATDVLQNYNAVKSRFGL